jgi:Family of unknown function (DUF5683)
VKNYFYIFIIVFFLGSALSFSQTKEQDVLIVKDSSKFMTIDPLRPAKAAFYSAILPGLGQAYNKKYWKIPLVYGLLGTAIGIYSFNDKRYNEVRDAYKRRLEGYKDDQFSFLTDTNRLVSAQKSYERNRDLSTFFIIGVYVLNIIDANVDAHLKQFNVNDKLSFHPDIQTNDITSQRNIAFTLNYQF